MIRHMISAAAALAVFPATAFAAGSGKTMGLENAATQLEARQHLVRQGYVNVSPLQADANGRWTGTAFKDGKPVIVAINLGKKPSATDSVASNALLDEAAAQREARQHLVRQGYVKISPLQRDVNGRWTGTAMKDGEIKIVAIDLRKPPVRASF